MKAVKVGLVGFGTMKSRFVDIPDSSLKTSEGDMFETDNILEAVFKYGQNDFQPQEIRSVSVGDIIFLPTGTYRVETAGFKYLDGAEEVWDAIAEEAGPLNERIMNELQRLYKVEEHLLQYQKDMDHDDSK